MASVFHYGPYLALMGWGLKPGHSVNWSFGPFEWDNAVVSIMAHPLGYHVIGDHRVMVTDIQVQKHSTGAGESQFVHCTIRNIGSSDDNYAIWLGVIRP
jgi:hypothetical protein